MDAIRGIFGVGVAQLMMLSVMVPAIAETDDGENDHRRIHGRRHSQVVSHSREDYPVITSWLTSPDSEEESSSPSETADSASGSQTT